MLFRNRTTVEQMLIFFRPLLTPDSRTNTVHIATMSFWGRRVNTTHSISSLVPPWRHYSGPQLDEHMRRNFFTRLEFRDGGDVYALPHRFGKVVDEHAFKDLMGRR